MPPVGLEPTNLSILLFENSAFTDFAREAFKVMLATGLLSPLAAGHRHEPES